MKRAQLIELNDQEWLPASIRDAVTDYLQFAIALGKPYAPIYGRLHDALQRSGSTEVVDLCSGGGGPWPTMLPEFPELTTVRLTDKYPNKAAMERMEASAGAGLTCQTAPVDATAVPPELVGFRTLFSSFHHFPPDAARALLRDAVERRKGIAIFEATHRSAPAVLAMFIATLLVLLCTPFIRPFRLSRLFWTYLLPVVPCVVLFDGIVSCLRTYKPAELRALVAELPASAQDYHWEIGEEKPARGGLPVTYLLGYPAPTPESTAA